MSGDQAIDQTDRRFMAAALRLSRKHLGLTGTNPSVGTLIVKDGVIVGRGVTAKGGRPHAEAEALAEAGGRARGATAYVTLEPCAHHGRTPPCANALVTAGIARVVGAANDPDERVAGKGYAILRGAGIEVSESVLAQQAADQMAGYLTRSLRKRPEVTLKLAISSDGMIGQRGAGQIAITGPESRAQAHLMRAGGDAILIGAGTAKADDPELTVRLAGLEGRSPIRIVLDPSARLPLNSKLATSATKVPVWVAACAGADPVQQAGLTAAGVRFFVVELFDGRIALPELLEDLAGQGISTLMVEGGADTASAFLAEGVVDRIALFEGPDPIGQAGVPSPLTSNAIPSEFHLVREDRFGRDRYREWIRPL